MKLSGNIRYFLTDRRKKVTLIVAIFIALSAVILQSYLLSSTPTAMVLMAVEPINIGKELDNGNTKLVAMNQSDIEGIEYLAVPENKVALRKIEAGALILMDGVSDQEDFIGKGEKQRYVTIKLTMEEADGWRFCLGDEIELIHFDEDQLNPLKVMKNIKVDELIKQGDNDDFPCYAVLLTSLEQRDYIVSNRHIGRFELSN